MNAADILVNRLLEDVDDSDAEINRHLSALPARQVSLFSETKPGDGMTAPMRVVLHKATHNGSWVTHTENMQVGGKFDGHYFGADYESAVADYKQRCAELGVPDKSSEFLESLAEAKKSPKMKALKDNRVELEPSERKEVMRRKAVWHKGHDGKASPAVWKSVVRGKTYYVCNTHRACAVKPTLKGAIRAFDFIKTTS